MIIDIDKRILVLRRLEMRDSPAAAIGAEELRIEALRQIASGCEDAAAVAAAVLITVDEDIGGD